MAKIWMVEEDLLQQSLAKIERKPQMKNFDISQKHLRKNKNKSITLNRRQNRLRKELKNSLSFIKTDNLDIGGD